MISDLDLSALIPHCQVSTSNHIDLKQVKVGTLLKISRLAIKETH